MARLIDADKLEKDLMDMAHNELMPDYFRQMCMSMAERVSKEPTIEAEPVTHGYWIPVDGGDSCDEWECSACGRVMTFTHEADYDDMREEFPRCPKCGAHMDVEEGG